MDDNNNKSENKAVFIDRDGTINEEVGHLGDIGKFKLLDDSAAAIQMLNNAGFKVVVITNQAGVARGYFDENTVKEINAHMTSLLAEKGAKIDAVYYCPHHPEHGDDLYKKDCDCRKPEPGLILRAAKDLSIDLSKSYMVGDTLKDMMAGKRAGCKTILVLTGYGEEELNKIPAEYYPSFVARDLYVAASWIVNIG